jgi:membrane-associated protease RseP (regulator of RpoE activity)
MKALVSLILSCTPLIGFLHGQDKPSESLLERLGSEEFVVREGAQAELSAWAAKNPQLAIPIFLKLFQEDDDPEVRKRALKILKELGNIDYLSEGQGYLGILMQEEPLNAAEGGELRFGIRVLNVGNGSPAEQAGLKMDDLILSLDGIIWKEGDASTKFRNAVAAMKPLADVTLMVQRGQAEPIGINVKLGKRPTPDLQAGGNWGLLEQQAKELHFQQWLKKQQEK